MIKKLRGYLFTGLVFWLPIFVTVLVISSLIDWLHKVELMIPTDYRPSHILGYPVPGLTFVFALLFFIFTGLMVTNWLGQKFIGIWEAFLERIPLVRLIYQTTKQMIQTFLMSNDKSFRQVVLIEYPRRDCWTLAFLTGEITLEKQADNENQSLYSVFVPTTPNPTSGFFLLLKEGEFKKVNISAEHALKLILSLGALKQPLRID